MSKSSKQKLNTKSSTKAPPRWASDYIPNSIWAGHFLEHQEYPLKDNTLHQDSQIAMKMERNGRSLCGQKSSHIDIRYFFIKDRVDSSSELEIIYYPSEIMVAKNYKATAGCTLQKTKGSYYGRDWCCHLLGHVLQPKGAC
jgi:hypothetical protein